MVRLQSPDERMFDLNMIPEEENEEMENKLANQDEIAPFNIAIGFRFAPTDPEIVIGYLKRFLDKEGLPQSKIHQEDVYRYHPDELSEKFEKANERELYFITVRNGVEKVSRSANNGFWHATTGRRDVVLGSLVIAEKQHFTFYNGKLLHGRPPKEGKTRWLMVEYRVVEVDSNTGIASRNMDAVLCKIYRSDDTQGLTMRI